MITLSIFRIFSLKYQKLIKQLLQETLEITWGWGRRWACNGVEAKNIAGHFVFMDLNAHNKLFCQICRFIGSTWRYPKIVVLLWKRCLHRWVSSSMDGWIMNDIHWMWLNEYWMILLNLNVMSNLIDRVCLKALMTEVADCHQPWPWKLYEYLLLQCPRSRPMIQNVGFESEDAKTRHCLKAEGMCTYSVLRTEGHNGVERAKSMKLTFFWGEFDGWFASFWVCLKLFEQSSQRMSNYAISMVFSCFSWLRSQEMQKSNAFSVEAKLIDTCEDACPEHHSRRNCVELKSWHAVKDQSTNHETSVIGRLSYLVASFPWPLTLARGELLYTEMACSLSHLRAIEQALAGKTPSQKKKTVKVIVIPYERWLFRPPCCVAGCHCVLLTQEMLIWRWSWRTPKCFWDEMRFSQSFGFERSCQDDIEIYPEFGADLERLLADAPRGSFGVLVEQGMP